MLNPSQMPKRKTKFDNPLEAGRYFLQLKSKGMSVEKIAVSCKKSVPAVYKYIALAEAPQSVLDAIDSGRIPATKVIRIMDTSKKEKNPGLSLEQRVENAINLREENQEIMERQGTSKMTVGSRLQAFQNELEGATTKNAKLLLDFAEKLSKGAPVSELLAMATARK